MFAELTEPRKKGTRAAVRLELQRQWSQEQMAFASRINTFLEINAFLEQPAAKFAPRGAAASAAS
jgi:hypothetical protein